MRPMVSDAFGPPATRLDSSPIMNIEDEFVLLLTASINPKGMPGVSQPDPEDRANTYLECLTYYLGSDSRVRKIVVAENSGWPLDRFQELIALHNPTSKEVELISLDYNNYPREKGKSYGELLLIDKALHASQLAKSSKYIGKMTGRNLLLNMTKVLEKIPRDFELFCDIRDHNFYQLLGMSDCGHHCDSRFFVFTHQFHELHLRGAYSLLPFENGYTIEGLLYDLVKAHEDSEPIIKRFRVEPEYRGSAGHFMKNKLKDYGSSKEMVKRRIRSCSRRVAPWLHI
jgi:hypothetical protein